MRWSLLRHLGAMPVVKLTPLIPSIGYLLLLNPNASELFELDKQLANAGWLTSQMRLLLLYFGLTLIGLGSIAYSVICPVIIKKYRDSWTYIDAAYGKIDMVGLLNSCIDAGDEAKAKSKFINIVNETNNEGLSPGGLADRSDKINKMSLVELRAYAKEKNVIPSNTVSVASALNSQYRTLDVRFRNTRYFVGALFVTGLVLVAVPSVDVLVRVCRSLPEIFGP